MRAPRAGRWLQRGKRRAGHVVVVPFSNDTWRALLSPREGSQDYTPSASAVEPGHERSIRSHVLPTPAATSAWATLADPRGPGHRPDQVTVLSRRPARAKPVAACVVVFRGVQIHIHFFDRDPVRVLTEPGHAVLQKPLPLHAERSTGMMSQSSACVVLADQLAAVLRRTIGYR